MNPISKIQTTRSALSLAISSVLLMASASSYAQETEQATAQAAAEEQMLEEVVVKASRLKGTASAVLQERQDQAFVADIMGADQISRTGDGDAAAALRRITGLTLVDGKFIYVRGLGERYSSTQLNSMGVPSPDPTRSVVPLDLFPADVIESLSVQKSYSPDMPAHFGGGNVDIRTKSMPSEFIFKLSGSLGTNTNNSDDGYFYDGGDDDWMGRDDGTRALPSLISNALDANGSEGIEGGLNTTLAERQALMSSLDWDISAAEKSVDPDFGLGLTLGDRYETDAGTFGFLTALSYDNEWSVNNESSGNNLSTICGEQCFSQYYTGVSTEHNVSWSGMLNFGYEFNKNHKFEVTNIALHDMRDRLRNRTYFDANETEEGVKELRNVDVVYEEREMFSTQVKGMHNFPELNFASFDWYYGKSRANRDAPGAISAVFEQDIEDGVIVSEGLQDVSAVQVSREYQTLHDDAETYGWNFAIPFTGDDWDIEIKAGADFSEKERKAENISFGIAHNAIDDDFKEGSSLDEIFSLENINNDEFYVSATGQGIFQDGTSDGDKYAAANKIDAYYLMADTMIGESWRISGGVRYEDFRQVSVPFQKHSNQFDLTTDELSETVFQEDGFFPSLAVTYIMDTEMQLRFNVSETAIRPDFRDVSSSSFIDPLTEFLVRGTPLLESSKIKHVDFRWEYYKADGNNISVALFYKDIDKPIETVELAGVGGGTPSLLTANGKEGEVYGVEVEFLNDLNFISLPNWFVSGNLTLSDSSVTLGFDDENSLFNQQLEDAVGQVSSNFVTNNERRLVGHSEWVANIQAGWDSDNQYHSASLIYNVFGPRIIVPGSRQNEDAEEDSFHSLDLVYTYYPTFASTVKFKVQNILNEDKNITQEGLALWHKEVGTSLDLSVSYDF